jgi:hypothetical protein
MASIGSILNPDYLVEPILLGRLHHNAPLRYCFRLYEEDPLTKNKQVNIITNQSHKLTIFKSDYKSATNRQINPLHIFNNAMKGLTKIPDYILFYELNNIIYAIIIELKSHHFTGVTDKFINGDNISKFIFNMYNCKKDLKVSHLLFRLPERSIKKPVYLKNDRSIIKQSFGFACTLDTVHFNQLINTLELI